LLTGDDMKSSVIIFVIGFVLAFFGSIVPLFGLPALIIGVIMMIWGIWQFMITGAWKAGKGVAKGVGRAAGDKRGSGKL
jgi:hypothetical protein